MLRLRNIALWNTGEPIDLVVPDSDPSRLLTEDGAITNGDIDATGWLLAPGFADPHVHFRDPGQTSKESMVSGCAAAASGGYTNVLIMPNTLPALDGRPVNPDEQGAQEVLDSGYSTVIEFLQHYEAIHHTALPVRFELSVCASVGRRGVVPTIIDDWLRYVPGHDDDAKDSLQCEHPVTAISDDGTYIAPGILSAVLANAQRAGVPVIDHDEHHESGAMHEGDTSRRLGIEGIAPETETTVVARDIAAAKKTGVHIHIQHVTTRRSFALIREAKQQGVPVTCETAPHYIALCDEDIERYGTDAKMNPPLRSADDRQAVIEAIADGTVDMIATDHAPHTMQEKAAPFSQAPNGVIGLESAYGVCHRVLVDAGYISDARLIELMSVATSPLFSHESRDPSTLLAGAPPSGDTHESTARRTLDLGLFEATQGVDLVVLNPMEHWTINPARFHSRARNTPFAHWDVTGRTLATIIGSRLVFSRIGARTVTAAAARTRDDQDDTNEGGSHGSAR